jgi:16S rRNA (uracil1498-N3)-methyltransferase
LDPARLEKKHRQWQAIIVASCEQSGRNQLPIVNPVSTLKEYLEASKSVYKFILHPTAHKRSRDYCLAEGDVALLIGPEGGLSEDEVKLAQVAHFQPLNLGPRILRTETAAVAALSLLQSIGGDL